LNGGRLLKAHLKNAHEQLTLQVIILKLIALCLRHILREQNHVLSEGWWVIFEDSPNQKERKSKIIFSQSKKMNLSFNSGIGLGKLETGFPVSLLLLLLLVCGAASKR